MTTKNAQIFLGIFVATMLVVAYVWYVTAPQPAHKPDHAKPTHPAAPTKPSIPEKIPVLVPPKMPALPQPPKEPAMSPPPVSIDMGIPALKPEPKISMLVMPDIAPPVKKVDPRLAAAVVTSGDEFDRLIDGAVSLIEHVFSH